MKTRNELEILIEQLVKKSNSVLAIGETSMEFEKRYGKKIEEFRFHKLRDLNPNIIGCDISKQNVLDAKKRGYNFVCVNIENANEIQKELGTKKFDLILMLNVIEHLSNTGLALENLNKLLTPKGQLLIMTDSPYYYRHFTNRIFKIKMEVAQDHTQFVVPENMIQLCKRYNFKLESVEGVHFIPNSKLASIIKHTVGRVHPYFLDNFLYTLRKKA